VVSKNLNSKLLITASALAFVAVGVLVVGSRFSPTANQTSGTIVGVQRYHSPQISSHDVQLGEQGPGGSS